MNRKKILLIVTLMISTLGFSQRIVINGIEGDRPLKWDDFIGKPDKDLPYLAFTICTPKSKINSFTIKGDTALVDVEFWLELNEKSWVKRDKVTDTLLQHEEGHFSIGKLWVRELSKRIKATVFFKKDYQVVINSIIKQVADKYRQIEQQYDKETDHHRIREQQWKWDSYFRNELLK
jgi:hypothetical protein